MQCNTKNRILKKYDHKKKSKKLKKKKFDKNLINVKSKQGRPPRNFEKGAVRCCRRAMRGYNSGLYYD